MCEQREMSSREKTEDLSNARCQKSDFIHCFVIHFLKNETACLFESLHHGIFVEVGLPYFPMRSFPFKYCSVKKLGALLLISCNSHFITSLIFSIFCL